MTHNIFVSPAAQAAINRIKTLQAISRKTKLATMKERLEVLLTLGNEDALTVTVAFQVGGLGALGGGK